MIKNCYTCASAKTCKKLMKNTDRNMQEIICEDYVWKTGQRLFIGTLFGIAIVVVLAVLMLILWYIWFSHYTF